MCVCGGGGGWRSERGGWMRVGSSEGGGGKRGECGVCVCVGGGGGGKGGSESLEGSRQGVDRRCEQSGHWHQTSSSFAQRAGR